MRMYVTEAGKNFREEVRAHHRRDSDFNCTLLQLFVVVDFLNCVIDIAQRDFDSLEKNFNFGRQGQLFLTAVEKLYV